MRKRTIIKRFLYLLLVIIQATNPLLVVVAEELEILPENMPTLILSGSVDGQEGDYLSVKKNADFELILSSENVKDREIDIVLPSFITMTNEEVDNASINLEGDFSYDRNENRIKIQPHSNTIKEFVMRFIPQEIGVIDFSATIDQLITSNVVTMNIIDDTEVEEAEASEEQFSITDTQEVEKEPLENDLAISVPPFSNNEDLKVDSETEPRYALTNKEYFIVNGGFEQPIIEKDSYVFFKQDSVPGWETTARDMEIEIANGFGGDHNFRAHTGQQWGEINANVPGELHQVVKSIPGSKMTWSVWHAGRDGTNTMAINIGTREVHETVALATSRNREWTRYSGTYIVPDDQYETYFGFESRNFTLRSVGNYIDDVSFKISGELEATKQASKSDVRTNDQVTYTINAKNTLQHSLLEDVIVEDVLPEGLELIEGSVKLNEVSVENESTNTNGIKVTIPTITSEKEAIVSFEVKISRVTDGIITNTATITDPENPQNPKKPEAKIKVQGRGNLEATKTVDRRQAKTGDIVEYKIETQNTKANTRLENILVEDPLPEGIELIKDSLKLNGESIENETTEANSIQVTIPKIAGEETVTISFQAKVTQDIDGTITNIATITDPEQPDNPQTPEIPITVRGPGKLETKKLVNQQEVKTGEIITYTIEAQNTQANTRLENILVEDPLPEGIELIKDSLKLNGESIENETTEANSIQVTIPKIAGEETVTISFQAKVTQDIDGTITNIATITDPEQPDNPQTPEIPITVRGPGKLETKKLVNQQEVKTGEIITYTIEAQNTQANTRLENILVEDPLPEGIELIKDSLKLNGESIENETTEANSIQVTIPKIAGEETVTIRFQAKVTQDIDGTITNIARITDPEQPDNPQTPEIPITVRGPGKLETKKLVNQQEVKTGDIVEYNIETQNTQANTRLENILVEDPLPEGIELIKDSLQLNGESIGNETTEANTIQVTIPKIAGEETVTISFQAKVTQDIDGTITNIARITDPEQPDNPQTPEIPITVRGPGKLETKKLVNQQEVKTGEIITYTIEAQNTQANTRLENILVEDPLPEGIELIKDSLQLNGESIENETTEANTIQVTIPKIAGEETVTIRFQAKVTQDIDGTITNIARITDPEQPDNPQTPEIPITVRGPGKLETKKLVNQQEVKTGEIITYTIEAQNTQANTRLENILVEDPLPEGIELIKDSLKLNGESIGNETTEANTIQVTIPKIAGEETVTIRFQAKVTQDIDGTITNIATITDPEQPDNPQTPEIPITVRGPGKLETKKLVNQQEVKTGEIITYTIEAQNTQANTRLENILVEDPLPEGIELIKDSLQLNGESIGNETTQANSIQVTIPKIVGEETVTIRFQAKVTQDIDGTITNIARITDPEQPDNPMKPEVSIVIQSQNRQRVDGRGIFPQTPETLNLEKNTLKPVLPVLTQSYENPASNGNSFEKVKEPIQNSNQKNKQDKTNTLPKTNEINNVYFSILGLIVIFITIIYFDRRKKI